MPASSPASGVPQPTGLPVSFGRKFRVWRYDVSHSELKLRSSPTASADDLIEVTFYGVVGMRLKTVYQPLTIAVAEPWQSEDMLRFANLEQPGTSRVRCVALRSEGDDGLVSCLGHSIWAHPGEPDYEVTGVPRKEPALILRE